MEQYQAITDKLKNLDEQKAGDILQDAFGMSLGIHQLVKEGNILSKITDIVKSKTPMKNVSLSTVKKNIPTL